jgi:D-glycero-D-manno-heptose 1,7-bisphosphate phosphatase
VSLFSTAKTKENSKKSLATTIIFQCWACKIFRHCQGHEYEICLLEINENSLTLGKSSITMAKCIFLDRDGVLNEDNPNYTYHINNFKILPGVIEALKELKSAGYLLVVVTNQSGIAQGIYTQLEMESCHAYLQKACGYVIDHFYFSPHHPSVSASLARKPGTLMFEKAKAKFNIDFSLSWMVGDRGRDIIPARLLGIKTIQIGDEVEPENQGDLKVMSLSEAASLILGEK